jgi:hypothetical protein
MEKITFDITDKGITVDSEGFKNDLCLKELDNLQKFLKQNGGIELSIVEQKKKPGSYVPAEKAKNGSKVI